jgi:hypothetical protein
LEALHTLLLESETLLGVPFAHLLQQFEMSFSIPLRSFVLQVQEPVLPVEGTGPNVQGAATGTPPQTDEGWIVLERPVEGLQAAAWAHPHIQVEGQTVTGFLFHGIPSK